MSDLGLQSNIVKLVDYNPKWPTLYEEEAEQLANTLGVARSHIQHAGSTSIPGMVAKPILDIAILVDSLDVVDAWRKKLQVMGYRFKGIEKFLPDRRFFAKGPRSNRTVYLHIVSQKEYDGLLKFRDALRNDPRLVQEYTALKHKLAINHADSRAEYTLSKNDFIQKVLSS